jgi:hypothetical protein
MSVIDVMQERLGAAGNLADTLAAAWDAFGFVQAAADGCAGQAPELFAAFLFAAAAAAEGRDTVGFAPSMPAEPGGPAGQVASGRGVDEIADELAGLAAVLDRRLQAAATWADNRADCQACKQAAGQARIIGDLLAPARR